jgi:hypothetical protein
MKSVIYKKEDGIIKNSLKFFKVNIIYNLSIVIACIIIGSINKDIQKAIFTGGVLYFWAYIVHIVAHKIPPMTFFHGFHHNHKINTTWYAELIETVVNILGSGGLSLAIMNMLVDGIFNIKLLDNDVLLFTTFLYTSFHMINYHVLKVPTHVKHHEKPNTNFGPDIMDILFNTKQDRDNIEDMNHGVINVVLILSLILITKNTKFDIMDNINKFLTVRLLPFL